LPLCKNLIMDGKLQENYEVNYPYYKVICSFNKTLPGTNSPTGKREHLTFRRPLKNNVWRE